MRKEINNENSKLVSVWLDVLHKVVDGASMHSLQTNEAIKMQLWLITDHINNYSLSTDKKCDYESSVVELLSKIDRKCMQH